jgi:hypothetical protein
MNTKWVSASSDPQWLMVDLGSSMPVNRVICKWDSAYAKSFKIQVATDTASWKDVYSTAKAGARSVTDETFATTPARYVRIYGTERGNKAKGYGIFDLMVLNDSLSTATSLKQDKPTIPFRSIIVFRNKVLQYHVRSNNSVKLDVVDGRGRLVTVLVNEFKNAGSYTAVLPGSLVSGLYIIRLNEGTKRTATLQVPW